MKRRQEDELVQAAFEDLDPTRAQAIERDALSDPEAVRALEGYRRMREDLRSLREVPPHQMSTERLRHAILHEGLKPSKPRPSIGWLWAPFAAAAVMFGVTLLWRGGGVTAPALVGLTDPSIASSALTAELSPRTFDVQPLDAGSKLEWVANAAPAAPKTDRPVRKARSDSRHGLRPKAMVVSTQEVPAPASPVDEGTPYSGVADLAVAATSVPSDSQPPIILIAAEEDASTGAQRATEVETASNVLVGG